MLEDVIRTMYNPKFIAELFRGQDMYSMQSTRQIFDKLAHSSIMRLNESSMDKVRPPARPPARTAAACSPKPRRRPRLVGGWAPRRTPRAPHTHSASSHAAPSHAAPHRTLRPATPRFPSQLFDLMTMGFKYQLIACRYPQELLHVTLNHLHQAPRHRLCTFHPLCTSPHLLSARAQHVHCTPPRRSKPLGTARHTPLHRSAPSLQLRAKIDDATAVADAAG